MFQTVVKYALINNVFKHRLEILYRISEQISRHVDPISGNTLKTVRTMLFIS